MSVLWNSAYFLLKTGALLPKFVTLDDDYTHVYPYNLTNVLFGSIIQGALLCSGSKALVSETNLPSFIKITQSIKLEFKRQEILKHVDNGFEIPLKLFMSLIYIILSTK